MSDLETSPEQLRDQLKQLSPALNAKITTEQADRVAAIIRDGIVSMDGDPADRRYLAGVLTGSWFALKIALLFPVPQLSQNLWIQTEVLRRMVDGEMPVVSISEMLGLGRDE